MDVLNAEDWRGSNASPSIEAADSPVRPSSAHDPLHLKARPGSPNEERKRAQDIVAAAKEAVAATFDDVRFGRRIKVAELQPIVDAIAESIYRNPLALPGVTRLKDRHEYTYLHSIAVCGLMIGLAKELGLGPDLTRELGLAGLLHDVGKAWVPLSILEKPGPLSPEEKALARQHTKRGHELLVDAKIDSEIALDVCLNHHERIDGGGYPAGVSGDTLSVYTRMAAVCDVYDARTAARTYRASWSPGETLEWMAESEGRFDGRILKAFRQMIGIFPRGSLVRLSSDRLAVVLDDDARCATPRVGVFLCAASKRELPLSSVDTVHDPILSLERAARWGLVNWTQRRATILSAL